MTPEEIHARSLVTSGVHVAQKMNDDIFNQPSFRKWSPETVAIGSVCLAAGFARGIDLPRNDFLFLCGVAFDMIRSSEKQKKEEAPSE